ncbi:DEAD/DEAH box helicase [Kribbella karoonensis]|uniref:RNA helicase n=1 Tax=Kribbella karoonensis TaxID=324851 RepID=A0ABN2DYI2_9ACTN
MLPEICDALDRVNIVEPFPIQEMTLPVALMGTDLIGQARTGTGKTLGFGIPLLQRTISPGEADYEELAAPGKPQALVVTPTRELTIQVAKDLVTASTVRSVRVLTIYGGVAYEPQLDALKNGVDVVVGTPGRLLDLANRGVLDLGHIKVLVLDEADEMLDLGFLPDVERILRKTPELRQTMLFSATMPSAVIGLARTHMRHPLNIRAESHEDTQMVPTTAQFVYRAHDLDKPEVVARILQAEDRGRVMIFCRTKREASRLTDDLQDRGFKAAAIHGDLNQQARERALTRFRGDKVDVLICTDVAARGIDVEGVTHVINNTCPEDEKAYIHRIGRTGRAGASGIAVTFVDWPDLTRWKVINKALDLPYDEPQEIYSTSPELYHDLGIPSEAKGRIRAARESHEVREPREQREQRGRREHTEGDGERSGRSRNRKRNRTRKRTRAGQPVEELADVTTKTEVPPTVADEAPARKSRKRNRNRRSGESLQAKATPEVAAEQPSAEVAEPTASVEAPVAVDTPAEQPAKRTRTRKTAAPKVEPVEVAAEEVPAKRTRKTAAKAATPATDTPATEVAAAEAPAAEAPVKRARTRKAAAGTPEAAEEAPAKRTRKTTAKKATEAPAAEAPTVEGPAAEAPVKRTRTRKAAAGTPEPTEEAPAKRTRKTTAKKATEAPAAEAPTVEAPVKRTRTRKAAATEPEAVVEAPAKRTRKTAAKATEAAETPAKRARKTSAKAAEAAEAPVKRARKTAKAAAETPAKKAAAKPAKKAAAKATKAPAKRATKAASAPLFKAPE